MSTLNRMNESFNGMHSPSLNPSLLTGAPGLVPNCMHTYMHDHGCRNVLWIPKFVSSIGLLVWGIMLEAIGIF